MKCRTTRQTLLAKLVFGLGAVVIASSTATPSHAGWTKYFIKSNATTCEGLMADMNAQNNTNFDPDNVVTEVYAGTIAEGIVFGSTTSTDQWILLKNVSAGQTSFDWEEVWETYSGPGDTAPTDWEAEGSNLVCAKSGNGRTCFATNVFKNTSGENVSDLNTTQKITEAWFCSDDPEPLASGGENCPVEGDDLADMFGPVPPQTILTGFDYHNNTTWTCGSPYEVVTKCTPESYAPLGQDPGADNPDLCDPKTEGCCTIDLATCLADNSNPSFDPVNCPQISAGGTSLSAGFQKSGEDSCGNTGGIMACSSFSFQ